jgi:glutaredoxin
MITVYGADWCEDTRRARRHLRRLGVAHEYLNIDEDLDALHRAKALNNGVRRTPVIDLGLGGPPLVEPDNDALIGALVERDMLAVDDVAERLAIQNVGDFERVLRTLAGAALLVAGRTIPGPVRAPVMLTGAVAALSGLTGWCPAYHAAGVTSLDGPGDRPDEGQRDTWLAPRADALSPASASSDPMSGVARTDDSRATP